MAKLKISFFDTTTKEFIYSTIKLNFDWVIALIPSNEISKNSVKVIIDKDLISDSPLKQLNLKIYEIVIKQTTLKKLKTNKSFFNIGSSLLINKKYAPYLFYNKDKGLIYSDIILKIPSYISKKKVLGILNANSS